MKTSYQADRRSPFVDTGESISAEEFDFARSFGQQLMHASAIAAADPSIEFPPRSIAARMQTEFSRLGSAKRKDIGHQAKKLLREDSARKKLLFGNYANWDAGHHRRTPVGLDDELKTKLRKAVRTRMEQDRPQIVERLHAHARHWARMGGASFHTTVEATTLLESGEHSVQWETELKLEQPVTIDFRWETDIDEATHGQWELSQKMPGFEDKVIAVGTAGPAPGGIVDIDLSNYLPPEPPNIAATYCLRVLPTKSVWFVGGGTTPETTDFKKKTSKPAGEYSTPVVITYCRPDADPVGQTFTLAYRKAHFYLDELLMVDDQTELGAEEFHIAGFVVETRADLSQTEAEFGPYFAQLAIDDDEIPKSAQFGKQATFNIGQDDMTNWPRVYTAVISLIEEDNGDTIAAWQKSVFGAVDEGTSAVISDEVGQWLKDHKDELADAGEGVGQFLAGYITGAAVTTVATAIANPIVGVIVAIVAVVAGAIIAAILAGAADDYYGTKMVVLTLPSGWEDDVESLAGESQPDGSYRAEAQKLQFLGAESWPVAAAWDGEAQVSVHWEFSDLETG